MSMTDTITAPAEPDPATVGPWKCFYCGEVFQDAVTAGRHFGDGEGCDPDPPCCVHPLRSDEKALFRELELARAMVDTAHRERDAVQDDADAYHGQSAELERLFGKGRNTAHQAWLELDDMKGRVLAAEEVRTRLRQEMAQAERKAWDALGRYKFWMFGYWAAQWVLLNRVAGANEANPWTVLVKAARERRKAA